MVGPILLAATRHELPTEDQRYEAQKARQAQVCCMPFSLPAAMNFALVLNVNHSRRMLRMPKGALMHCRIMSSCSFDMG